MTPKEIAGVTGARWMTFRREAKTGSGVYILVLNGEIVYVGQSVHIPSRVKCHIGGKAFDSIFWAEEKDYDKRLKLEKDCIRVARPILNVKHVDESGKWVDGALTRSDAVRRNRVLASVLRGRKNTRNRASSDPLGEWYKLYNTPGKREAAMKMLRE